MARKATFLLALIWIGSPVAGLRPMRAARFPHLQTSEFGDLHSLAFLQVLSDQTGKILKNLLALLFGELMFFRQSMSQLLCADRLSGCRLGCRGIAL